MPSSTSCFSGGGTALLIIDMINCFDFPGAENVQRSAERAADAIMTLRDEARSAGLPVIYVNDNFGDWHSEKSQLIAKAEDRAKGALARLRPEPDDPFVIKPQFSGFYATNLPVLLPKFGVSRLILTGIATDICVLFTAADAHMRDYALWVPRDAVGAEDDERGAWAIEIMEQSMGAETAATDTLSIKDWLAHLDEDH